MSDRIRLEIEHLASARSPMETRKMDGGTLRTYAAASCAGPLESAERLPNLDDDSCRGVELAVRPKIYCVPKPVVAPTRPGAVARCAPPVVEAVERLGRASGILGRFSMTIPRRVWALRPSRDFVKGVVGFLAIVMLAYSCARGASNVSREYESRAKIGNLSLD